MLVCWYVCMPAGNGGMAGGRQRWREGGRAVLSVCVWQAVAQYTYVRLLFLVYTGVSMSRCVSLHAFTHTDLHTPIFACSWLTQRSFSRFRGRVETFSTDGGSWASTADRNAPGDGEGVKSREKPCASCGCTICLSTCKHPHFTGCHSTEGLNTCDQHSHDRPLRAPPNCPRQIR